MFGVVVFAFGNWDGKKYEFRIWYPGSEINITDHISESLVTIFWVKKLKFLMLWNTGFGAFLA
jgi:hypothetical protein